MTVRDDEKGPVAIEPVTRRVQTRRERKRTGSDAWLVVTRCPLVAEGTVKGQTSPDTTEQNDRYRYQSSLTPTSVSAMEREAPSLSALARVIKTGTSMEVSLKRGKSEAGMDADQVRTWEGWPHHTTLTLITAWFFIEETRWTPALPLPHVRYGLSVLLLEVVCILSLDDICRHVQRPWLRTELARLYHHHTRHCLPPRKLREDIQKV